METYLQKVVNTHWFLKNSSALLKEDIQHFKTEKFTFLLFLWVIYALLDLGRIPSTNPDPADQNQCGSERRNTAG